MFDVAKLAILISICKIFCPIFTAKCEVRIFITKNSDFLSLYCNISKKSIKFACSIVSKNRRTSYQRHN